MEETMIMECVRCGDVEPIVRSMPDPKNPKVGIQTEECPRCGGVL